MCPSDRGDDDVPKFGERWENVCRLSNPAVVVRDISEKFLERRRCASPLSIQQHISRPFAPRLCGSTLPGFMSPSGSRLFLISFIVCTAPAPSSSSRYFTFPTPTPCSPVHVPPKAIARCTINPASRSASCTSASLAGSNMMKTWKLPSPACATIGQSRSEASSCRLLSEMSSSSFESGTQTSVIIGSFPGLTAIADQSASFLAFQSSFISCSAVATFTLPAPRSRQSLVTCLSCSCTPAAEPVTSNIMCVRSGKLKRPAFASFSIRIMTSSMSSARPTCTPDRITACVASAAAEMLGKSHIKAAACFGSCCTRSVASVMTASVPSLPISSRVRSYPAALLRARDAVLTMRPSESTAVMEMTLSRIVPYRTAVLPEQRQAHIPPMLAPGPGSSGKKSPCGLSISFSSTYPSPASTVTSSSSTLRRFRAFISFMSRHTPPTGVRVCPSSEVAPPYGTRGTRCFAHSFTSVETSSVVRGRTITSGLRSTLWYELQGLP
mmetsp:Transcript_11009/g.36191  ORF Transcript_11009/g.36191 Transcript_11009/m.36191 type:complete len:496 (+) Transcript_11009:321-1808(+)